MGCVGSKKEDTYARYPALTDWQIEALRLPAPPLNGFDSFLRLAWCRDLKEERLKAEQAEKEAKQQQKQKAGKQKNNKGDTTTPTPTPVQGKEIPKSYYICLVANYGGYDDNATHNLQTEPDAYQYLPRWQDVDYLEDCIRNGPFYQNDAWLLEHVPTAIRKPSGYLYPEQFAQAFAYWNNGMKPPPEDVLRNHLRNVATTLYRELHGYAMRGGKDSKGRDRRTTIEKLENILRSLELDVKLLTECQKTVEAEYAAEQERLAKQAEEKRIHEEKIAKETEAKRVKEEEQAEAQRRKEEEQLAAKEAKQKDKLEKKNKKNNKKQQNEQKDKDEGKTKQ